MALLDKVSSGLTKVLPKLQSDRELAQFMRENLQPIAPEVADETLQGSAFASPTGVARDNTGLLEAACDAWYFPASARTLP